MPCSSSTLTLTSILAQDMLSDDEILGRVRLSLGELLVRAPEVRPGKHDFSAWLPLGKAPGLKSAQGEIEVRVLLLLPTFEKPPDPDSFDDKGRRKVPPLADIEARVRLKPFQCEFCGRRFKRSFTLSLHYDLHASENPRAVQRAEEEKQRAGAVDVNFEAMHFKGGSDPFNDAKCGRLNLILRALGQGRYDIEIRERRTQKNMLHVASQWGERNVVLALCRRGANVDAQDKHGNTALSMAAHYGHAEIVELRRACRRSPGIGSPLS